jgi:hypothetical protein
MKTKILFLVLILLNSKSFTQELSLQVSNEALKNAFYYFNNNSQYFYNSSFNVNFDRPSYDNKLKSEFTLLKYSTADLSLVYNTNIIIPKENDAVVLPHSLIPINNEIILFTTHYNKNDKSYKLMARKIDENGVLGAINEIASGDYCNYKTELSKDQKSIVVIASQNYSSEEKTKPSSSIIVLNQDLGIIWNEKMEINYGCYNADKFNKPLYYLDKFYFLGYSDAESATRDNNSPKIKTSIFCFDLKNKKLTKMTLPIEKGPEVDPYGEMNYELEIGINNQIILIALPVQSKVNNKLGIKPYFLHQYCFLFNNDLTELKFQNKIDYSAELSGNGKSIVKDIFQDDNGKIYYIVERTSKIHSTINPNYDAEYYSILVNSIDPNENVSWTKEINKVQAAYGFRFFSFVSLYNGEEIFIVLNNKYKSKQNEQSITSENYVFDGFDDEKNAKTVVLTIDKNGVLSEDKSIIELNNQSYNIETNNVIRLNKKESIFFIRNEKGRRLGKLKVGR